MQTSGKVHIFYLFTFGEQNNIRTELALMKVSGNSFGLPNHKPQQNLMQENRQQRKLHHISNKRWAFFYEL